MDYGHQSTQGRGAESIPDANVDRMVGEIERAEQRRSKFSRRRTFHEEDDVTGINGRNDVYNRKIARAFDKSVHHCRAPTHPRGFARIIKALAPSCGTEQTRERIAERQFARCRRYTVEIRQNLERGTALPF